MTKPLADPKIYHITHVENLVPIITDGGLVSDAAMITRGGPAAPIGMTGIKRRRLTLPLHCHQGDHVADYVPFYFCPRSIMLYVIYRGNHPELSYTGGQGPIVHLEADLHEVVAWADNNSRRWAFSLSNAGAYYAEFRSELSALDELDWDAIRNTDFRSREVKEGKQAEFLFHGTFPWELVSRIGVRTAGVGEKVADALQTGQHKPGVEIRLDWYY